MYLVCPFPDFRAYTPRLPFFPWSGSILLIGFIIHPKITMMALIKRLAGTNCYGICLNGIILFSIAAGSMVYAAEGIKPNEQGPFPAFQVNTFTGNLFYMRTDLVIPSRGEITLAIRFSYNSLKNETDRGYGNGWSFNFGMWYSKAENAVAIGREDGEEDEFTWNGVLYNSPVGVYDVLTEYAAGKYLLTSKHGIKYYFDDPVHKQLTKIIDRNGNTFSITCTDGKPTVITDPGGRMLNLSWSNGHLSQITDPNTSPSRTISYQYDGSWNVVQVTRPLTNVFHYGYDGFRYMTSVTDPRSSEVIISYNLNKAVAGIGCPAVNYLKTFSYDPCKNTTTVSQAVSTVTRHTIFTFDTSGRVISILYPDANMVSFEWDIQDFLVTSTDESGHPTTWTHDAKGNRLSETDCLGNTASCTYEPTYNRPAGFHDKKGNLTAYSYDLSGNLTEIVDCLGNTESFAYNSHGERISSTDKMGATTTFNYNTSGDLTIITDPLMHAVTNTYDLVGNLISTTDKRGFTTTYSYDLLNRHTGTVDALGYTSAYAYDANGNLTSETKPNGYITTYTYDPLNRLISRNSSLEGTTSFTLDEAGNKTAETNAKGCTQTYTYSLRDHHTGTLDPLGNAESSTYSPVGRMLSSTDKGGNTTTYQYDCMGRLTKKTDPAGFYETITYDAEGNMTSFKDKNGNTKSFTLGCLNRISVTNFPLGYSETTVYTAAGRISEFHDKDGKVTLYGYDVLGKLTSVTDPLGHAESYTYDAGGNRASVTDKNSHSTTYAYDNLGRLSSVTDPLGHSESYGYDPDGNRTSLTNKRGNTTAYTYDGLDRLISSTDPLGHSESYTFDQLSNQTAYTDKNGNTSAMTYDCLNRNTTKTDPLGFSDTFAYDAAGHTISHTDRNGHMTSYAYSCCRLTGTTDPLGYTESYGYDANGNKTSITDKNGHITVSAYDGLNRLISVTTPMGHQTLCTYNGTGKTLTKTDANLHTVTNVYNDRGELTGTTYPDATAETYTYDYAGNITQASNTGGIADVTNYSYDALNRLISKSTNYGSFSKTHTASYDNNGNRIGMTAASGTSSYVYDNADRLSSITDQASHVTTFTNDNAGNQLMINYPNGVHTSTTYDALTRATQVVTSDAVILKRAVNQNLKTDTILPNSPLYTIDCGVMQIISPQSGPGLTNHETVTIILKNYGTSPVSGALARYTIDGGTPVTEPVLQTLYPGNQIPFSFSQTANLSIPGQSYQVNACVIVTGDQNPVNNCQNSTVVNQSTGGGINQSFTYTYDHVGNKTSELHEDGSSVSFQYNNRNQLVQEEPAPSGDLNLYTYTPSGKRASITKNGALSTYGYNNDDVVISAGSTAYVPDNNGNRISMTNAAGTTQYSYGYKNEMKHVILPDLSFVDYKYSPFRGLLAKNDNGVQTYFQSDGNEYLALVDAAGQPVEFYTPGLTINHNDSTGYYYYNGYQGSTMQADPAKTVLATTRFDAFGVVVQSTGRWLGNRIVFRNCYKEDPGWVDNRHLAFNWIEEDKSKLYLDGYGLFLDKYSGTVINGNPGEKIKDQAPKEPETNKPQGTGGGNPVEEKAKPKCCGVKKFDVTWSIPIKQAYPGNLLRLDVVIEFMDDETHSPACCEYCQFVSSSGNGTDAKGPWRIPAKEGRRHDDGYSRIEKDENGVSFDYDGNPALSHAGFETNDNPGIKGLKPDETIDNYSFTAEQAVYEICPSPCPTWSKVAKNGPHTATVKGKSTYDYTFDGEKWAIGDTKK